MKTLAILGLAGCCWMGMVCPSHGQTTNITVNQTIPDNDPNGLASAFTLSLPGVTSITDVNVQLIISGGFNGDLMGYLSDGTSIAYLLNRSGRSATSPFGYTNGGFNVTFDDGTANGDVHNYQLTLNPGSGPLTGTWEPDARASDPALTLDSSPRTAFLSAFNGSDPNATWTLFLTDNSPGNISTLQSWGVSFVAVPEPATWALLLGEDLPLLWALSRRRK